MQCTLSPRKLSFESSEHMCALCVNCTTSALPLPPQLQVCHRPGEAMSVEALEFVCPFPLPVQGPMNAMRSSSTQRCSTRAPASRQARVLTLRKPDDSRANYAALDADAKDASANNCLGGWLDLVHPLVHQLAPGPARGDGSQLGARSVVAVAEKRRSGRRANTSDGSLQRAQCIVFVEEHSRRRANGGVEGPHGARKAVVVVVAAEEGESRRRANRSLQ